MEHQCERAPKRERLSLYCVELLEEKAIYFIALFERKEMCDTDRYATGTQPRGCNAVWGDHCVGMDQSHNQAVSSGECQCSVPSATAWCRCALTGSGETAKRSPSAENCCPLSASVTLYSSEPPPAMGTLGV